MFSEVQQLEENMFHLLCAATTALQEGRLGATKQYVVALGELEDEYYKITKKEFTNPKALTIISSEIKKYEEIRHGKKGDIKF